MSAPDDTQPADGAAPPELWPDGDPAPYAGLEAWIPTGPARPPAEPYDPAQVDPHAGAMQPGEPWDDVDERSGPAAPRDSGRRRAASPDRPRRARRAASPGGSPSGPAPARPPADFEMPPFGEPSPAGVAPASDAAPDAPPSAPGPLDAARIALASQEPEGTGTALLQASARNAPPRQVPPADRSGAHDAALARFGERMVNQIDRPEHRQYTDSWRGVSDDGDVPPEIIAGALDLLIDGIPAPDGTRQPPDGRTGPNLAALVRRFPALTVQQAQRALTVARRRIADGIRAAASSEGAMIKDAIWRNVHKAEATGRFDHAIAGLRTLAAIHGLSQAGESQTARASRLSDAELDAAIDQHVDERIAAKPAAEIARIREGVDLLSPDQAPARTSEGADR